MKQNTEKNIGFGIKAPEKECGDRNCPFHGKISVRGRIFEGVVTSDKMRASPTVEWGRSKFVAKYERYKKARTKVKVHNPPCINAKKGDKVKIIECRPISKTKSFIIVEKAG